MAEELERIYVIPLKKVRYKSSSAADSAIKVVRSFLTKHMKVEEDKIWIDDSLNNAIWAHGKYWVPSKIRVKAVKFDDGVVEAYIPELDFKKSRREILKEEKEAKEPILRKEEAEEGTAEGTGAEKYDVAPSGGEGEVKIKKKKASKEKEEKKEEPVKKPKKKEDKEEIGEPKIAEKKKAKASKKPSESKTKDKTTSKRKPKKKSE
jgi:large subunit ribosomal protein L31e